MLVRQKYLEAKNILVRAAVVLVLLISLSLCIQHLYLTSSGLYQVCLIPALVCCGSYDFWLNHCVVKCGMSRLN